MVSIKTPWRCFTDLWGSVHHKMRSMTLNDLSLRCNVTFPLMEVSNHQVQNRPISNTEQVSPSVPSQSAL